MFLVKRKAIAVFHTHAIIKYTEQFSLQHQDLKR